MNDVKPTIAASSSNIMVATRYSPSSAPPAMRDGVLLYSAAAENKETVLVLAASSVDILVSRCADPKGSTSYSVKNDYHDGASGV